MPVAVKNALRKTTCTSSPIRGCSFRPRLFKPAIGKNPDAITHYEANRFEIVQQMSFVTERCNASNPLFAGSLSAVVHAGTCVYNRRESCRCRGHYPCTLWRHISHSRSRSFAAHLLRRRLSTHRHQRHRRRRHAQPPRYGAASQPVSDPVLDDLPVLQRQVLPLALRHDRLLPARRGGA